MIEKVFDGEVSLLSCHRSRKDRVRRLFVLNIVSTSKRVRVFTAEYIHCHSNRLGKEMTVDIAN